MQYAQYERFYMVETGVLIDVISLVYISVYCLASIS